MSELVRYDVTERVAVLTIDNPPVNALGPQVWEALDQAVARAAADGGVDAVVVIGAGSTFIAGADITVFGTMKTREHSLARSANLHAILRRLEDTPKPVVAAIHGNALGGGLEVAQACHYRVALATAKVGQPEVLLGIFPGAAGTQRLPRLAGVPLALEMCTEGKPISAAKAAAAGIIDEIVDGSLIAGALKFARARAAEGAPRKTREIVLSDEAKAEGRAACDRLRKSLKTPKELRAPSAAIDAIEASLTLDFEAGSLRERELFTDCVLSLESKALRHLFFA